MEENRKLTHISDHLRYQTHKEDELDAEKIFFVNIDIHKARLKKHILYMFMSI